MPRIEVKPLCYLVLALILVLVPIQLALSWCFAVWFHELGHFCALRCFGHRVYCLRFGLLGVQMETERLSGMKGMLCALAGPAFSAMLLLFRRIFPVLALCGLFHCLVNLLPVMPLDGGRFLSLALERIPEKHRFRILRLVEMVICVTVFCVGGYLTLIRYMGVIPLFACGFLAIRRKLSCKQQRQIVQ